MPQYRNCLLFPSSELKTEPRGRTWIDTSGFDISDGSVEAASISAAATAQTMARLRISACVWMECILVS
jgi:hypothetical protein